MLPLFLSTLWLGEPTWVLFAEKEVPDPDAALTRAERDLAPRALARRVRERRDRGVDLRDVPPSPAAVAAVLATGARLRAASRWLNAISVDADAAQRAAIAALPQVAALRPVARGVRGPAPSSARSAADLDLSSGTSEAPAAAYGFAEEQVALLGVPELHACGLSGAGVVLGVQDSGFTLGHKAFAAAQVIAARDFVHGDDQVADEPNDKPGQDDHGTMVLSTIIGQDGDAYGGVAPGVSVILAKTEDISVEAPIEEDYFVAGLEWIEGMGADLWTASLGYLDWYTYSDLDGQTTLAAQASLVALQNGLIMFNAIGNSGPGPATLSTPSDTDGVIAVGAVDLGGALTNFSSRGPTADGRIKPDVLAPGGGVWMVDPNSSDQYGKANGTSFAAPMAAGVGALLKQAYPKLGPKEMADLLRSTASDAAQPGNDRGWGLIDGPAAAGLYCTCTDADHDEHFDVACGGDDCDDSDPATFPGAPEVCDGRDNNCDLSVPPDEVDADMDGVRLCALDCDDADPSVHPGAPEVPHDCADNDCDGQGQDDCGSSSGTGGDASTSAGAETSATTILPDTSTGLETSGATAPASGGPTGDEDGCGCSSDPRAPWSLALLALLPRRRKRAPARPLRR